MAITYIDQPKLFHLTDGTHFSFVLKISKTRLLTGWQSYGRIICGKKERGAMTYAGVDS